MKLLNYEVKNYRTLELVDLSFPSFYTAICGKNDSGKSNVLRVIRGMMKEGLYSPGEDIEFSYKEDFPKWKQPNATDNEISFSMKFLVNKKSDAGLFSFLTSYLTLRGESNEIEFIIQSKYKGEQTGESITIIINNTTYSDIQSQEVLKKLQSSQVFLFHNSTEAFPSYYLRRGYSASLAEFSGDDNAEIEKLKKAMNTSLKKIRKRQQFELTNLLGRLESKYNVGLSLPAFNPAYMPFNITLGDKTIDVDLDSWGSGTRNRTLILLTLFRARQISESVASASKITPIIIIEEPESFLHPSAQAEFGRILQDLSEEFNVQVIVTTHSPYLLSQRKPESNVLLERKQVRNHLRETTRINTVGESWMKPFGEALGIDNKEFLPWKDLFYRNNHSILLVEGDIDKAYFEMLRSDGHGINKLNFDGEIFPYGGCGNLNNAVLLRFIKNRFKNIFITYDLDSEAEVEPKLKSLGFEKGKHFLGIGLNSAGKKAIEGLLPESIKTAVRSKCGDIVDQALHGDRDEKKDSNLELKKLYLKAFQENAIPGDEYYKHFYYLVKHINKALL